MNLHLQHSSILFEYILIVTNRSQAYPHKAVRSDAALSDTEADDLGVIGKQSSVLEGVEKGLEQVIEITSAAIGRISIDRDFEIALPKADLLAFLLQMPPDEPVHGLAVPPSFLRQDHTSVHVSPVSVDGWGIREIDRNALLG